MDSAIVEWAREERGMSIGLPTAERLKLQVGSAVALNEEPVMEVAGLHLASGLPRRMHVHGREVREAIEPVVQQMVAVAAAVLDVTPPELSADLGETGIVLTGGVARLAGLAERVAEATSLPVRVGDRPERAVVTGCGRCVEEPYLLAAALS
jgi:rod shape-determining protein MreB